MLVVKEKVRDAGEGRKSGCPNLDAYGLNFFLACFADSRIGMGVSSEVAFENDLVAFERGTRDWNILA